MGLFGPSRKEKFVQGNAQALAEYLKNNAVKLGGEAYAKCQFVGIFPPEIDTARLWYFWSVVFAFRVAQDTLALKRVIDDKTSRLLFEEFCTGGSGSHCSSIGSGPSWSRFSRSSWARSEGSTPAWRISAWARSTSSP